jgi:hypothetical protein
MTKTEEDLTNSLRRKLLIVAVNLPLHCSSAQLSAMLWAQIGLAVSPHDISCRDSGEFSTSAFVWLSEDAIADFLSRNFAELHLANGPIRFERKKWAEDAERGPKLKVSSITFELPAGVERNRHGLPILK